MGIWLTNQLWLEDCGAGAVGVVISAARAGLVAVVAPKTTQAQTRRLKLEKGLLLWTKIFPGNRIILINYTSKKNQTLSFL